MIPFKGKHQGRVLDPPKPTIRVRALHERQRDHEIRFPNVESYSFELSHNAMTTDVEAMRQIKIEAVEGVTVGAITLDEGRHVHVGVPIEHTLATYYDAHPLQTTLFRIVSEILEKLPGDTSRSQLFPRIFWLVENYTRMKIEFLNSDGDPRVLWNPRCRGQVVDMFVNALQPDKKAGEAPLLPIVDPSNPVGSSKDVDFFTTKDCHATQKSHLNFVAVDSGWEGSAAYHFERSNLVKSYVRNERLGFIIRYHFEDEDHDYYPDFIVRLTNDLNLILEIKGKERRKDPVKYEAAKRWVDAVNHARKYGRWAFDVCDRLQELATILKKHNTTDK